MSLPHPGSAPSHPRGAPTPDKPCGSVQTSLASPGVPAEAGTTFTAFRHQRLRHPALGSSTREAPSQVFCQREDKPWMFRCHHCWTTHETPGLETSATGQVTHLKRKLRHTQTTASGVSHAGVQSYKLLLDSRSSAWTAEWSLPWRQASYP